MARRRPSVTALIMAAGQGTRLRSKKIKLLHEVAGQPMLAHVVAAARSLRPERLITIVGYQADLVTTALGEAGGTYVLQREQNGTGHAVLQAARAIGKEPGSTLLILNGDVPTLRGSTLRRLVARHRQSGAVLSLLSAEIDDPTGYGRVLRDARGQVLRIVEDRDTQGDEAAIREINCGMYCAEPARLLAALRSIRPDNAQGEYYITDAVRWFIDRGQRVAGIVHHDAAELLGVNTRAELAHAGRRLFGQKALELMDSGVTILDPSRTWIDPRARIGRDSVIHPDVQIEGASVLGEDCVVRSGCRLTDTDVGRGSEIRDHSVCLEARIGNGVTVGPFAHLRPGSVLEDGSKVGNFVELKKTRLGRGSKASHLTYLGDSDIAADCNIGAGTITCNFDGVRKHKTTLGRGVFVGSNSQLVAPVTLGDGAYVAAGSTVTKDVPPNALAIARSRQRNVDGWTTKNAARHADEQPRKAAKRAGTTVQPSRKAKK